MNRIELKGGLTRDPESRVLESGQTMCWMTLAVNGTRYDTASRQQVVKSIFVACQGWGPVAVEMLSLHKGDEVYLVGELDQYKKADEEKHSTRVTVFTLSVLRESTRQSQQQEEDPWAK